MSGNYPHSPPPSSLHAGQYSQYPGQRQPSYPGRPPARQSAHSPIRPPHENSHEAQLLGLFRAVDQDGSGSISEIELRRALVNGDWTEFHPATTRLMIKLFDKDMSGTINFQEFKSLWNYLKQWKELFVRFDKDGSGSIDIYEFSEALRAFGYRLSPEFVNILFHNYDKRGTSIVMPGNGAVTFDMFIQSCVTLKTLTEVFKKYDEDRASKQPAPVTHC
ncbi:Programmed cell death protein 6 [Neolecta irregularis DAH-3]|uniref:Programmed cell death protein 6 n=1 Tax=Neolecta irregularis (strain DAH-3) TaxID=1198029 RepID=A0A1U7LMQ8_NEOID|nr:Programmed cell death protein 6 [Neolecta irregularis DAH-3]|eukprot:OLL23929.1 Programmed cell death protein 6 [Neolecta irregularis DAH-3]